MSHPFNITPRSIQVSKINIKRRSRNDKRKVANQKTYLQYRVTLPQSFVDTHKLAKTRKIYLVSGEIGMFIPNETSLMKVMLLMPEINALVQKTGNPLNTDEIRIVLQRFPEIKEYVRSIPE